MSQDELGYIKVSHDYQRRNPMSGYLHTEYRIIYDGVYENGILVRFFKGIGGYTSQLIAYNVSWMYLTSTPKLLQLFHDCSSSTPDEFEQALKANNLQDFTI
jgi:hypothetical protein